MLLQQSVMERHMRRKTTSVILAAGLTTLASLELWSAEQPPGMLTAGSGRALLKAEDRTNVVPTLATNLATNTARGMTHPAATASSKRMATGWGQKLKEGGTTAIVQILISVFGAGFAFERFFRLRRKYIAPEGMADQARALWQAGKFAELEKLPEQQPSTLARVIAFIVRHRTSSVADLSAMTGDLVSRELSDHHQKAYPMGVIATLEPLLGLLGMILGMIETFETVALAGALGDPTQLASGISEALVTTGLGLATAIPFLALYHYFKSKTNAFGTLLEEQVTDLMGEWLLKQEAPHAR
jgi:biopolymer transport protein ExbB